MIKRITANQLITHSDLTAAVRNVREEIRSLRQDRAQKWRKEHANETGLPGADTKKAIPEPCELRVEDLTSSPNAFGETFALRFDGERIYRWERGERDHERVAAMLNCILDAERLCARITFENLPLSNLNAHEMDALRSSGSPLLKRSEETRRLFKAMADKPGHLNHCIAQLEYSDPKEETHIQGYSREAAIAEIRRCVEGWGRLYAVDLAQVDWAEFALLLEGIVFHV